MHIKIRKCINIAILGLVLLFECNATLAEYNSLQYSLIFLLALILVLDNKTIKVDSMIMAMATFLIWNVMTVFWTVDVPSTAGAIVMVAKWIFIMLFISNRDYELNTILFIYSLVQFIDSIILLPNIDYSTISGRRGHHIVGGIEWSTNMTSGMFSIAIFLLFFLLLQESQIKYKAILLSMMFPLGLDIVLMGSRQGFIVAIGSCILLLLLKNWKGGLNQKNIIGIVLLMIVVLVLCWAILNNEILYNTIGYRLRRVGDTNESDLGRIEMIVKGFELFLEKPILGYGSNTFYYSSNHMGGYAHNNFVELLADTGIVGFVTFHWAYILMFCRIHLIKDRLIKSMAWSCILISLFFEMIIVTFPLFHYQFLLWVAYVLIYKRQNSEMADRKENMLWG